MTSSPRRRLSSLIPISLRLLPLPLGQAPSERRCCTGRLLFGPIFWDDSWDTRLWIGIAHQPHAHHDAEHVVKLAVPVIFLCF